MLLLAVWLIIFIIPRAVEARSALVDSTDVKIRNASSQDATGSETSVFIHPTDSRIVLVSIINQITSGVSAWVSQDGGMTWAGDNSAAGGSDSYGDPAAVIRRSIASSPVRYLVGQLTAKAGQKVIHKENATSLSWASTIIKHDSLGKTDKNHLWVDNHAESPENLRGRLYSAWSTEAKRVEAMYSFNAGASWTGLREIDATPSRAEWGVNLVVSTSPGFVVLRAGQETLRHKLTLIR